METFDITFWMIIGIVVSASMVAIMMQTRKKDRGLRIFNKFHSIVGMEDGTMIWGTIKIFPNGLEIMYDKPYKSNGLTKSSYMLYRSDIGNILVLMRCPENLTPGQARKLARQVNVLIKRGSLIKTYRWATNFFRRLKDAIRKIVALTIGQAYKVKQAKSYSASRSHTNDLGDSVVNVIDDNLFEPMLEQYIGHQGVVELSCPAIKEHIELSGYLIDYSDKFIALVNKECQIADPTTISLIGSIDEANYSVTVESNHFVTVNKSDVPMVVENARNSNSILLIKGSHIRLPIPEGSKVKIGWAQYPDIIVPRDLAKVRHATRRKD